MVQRYIKDIFSGEYKWIEDDTPPPKRAKRRAAGPYIIRDIDPYRSVVTGEMITSRREHREYLKRNDLVEIGNEKLEPPKPEQLSDPAEDMHRAMDMINQGYKPDPVESLKDWE